MDPSGNYRMYRCVACNGTGFIRAVSRDDYKNTDKMSPTELEAIAKSSAISPVPPAPARFSPEPPTLPDEGWMYRHIAQAGAKQWRWIQLALSLLLILLAYVLGRQQ